MGGEPQPRVQEHQKGSTTIQNQSENPGTHGRVPKASVTTHRGKDQRT
jgi:hypothetical protein